MKFLSLSILKLICLTSFSCMPSSFMSSSFMSSSFMSSSFMSSSFMSSSLMISKFSVEIFSFSFSKESFALFIFESYNTVSCEFCLFNSFNFSFFEGSDFSLFNGDLWISFFLISSFKSSLKIKFLRPFFLIYSYKLSNCFSNSFSNSSFLSTLFNKCLI